MFEIGDTICNVADYNQTREIKGCVLNVYDIYVVLVTSNGKNIIDTYIKPFAYSKIVLLEKIRTR